MPRSTAETVTCALATLAPDESRTVPVTEAESWAGRSVAENKAITKTILLTRRIFIRDSLWLLEMKDGGTSLLGADCPSPEFESEFPDSIYFAAFIAVDPLNKEAKIPLLKRVNSASAFCWCQVKRRSLLSLIGSLQAAGGFADDQVRDNFAVNCAGRFFFEAGIDGLDNDRSGSGAHGFHWLTNRSQRGAIERCGSNVIDPDHGSLFGIAHAGFGQSADRAEGGHVVEGHQSSEGTAAMQQFLRQLETVFETGERIARLGQVDNQLGINRKIVLASNRAYTSPARFGIGQLTRASDESDLAVA